MIYFAVIKNGYVDSFGTAEREVATVISEARYNEIKSKLGNHPTAPAGYTYKLRADNLEWELVELPPETEYEPTIEDKAEAYDILIGGAS